MPTNLYFLIFVSELKILCILYCILQKAIISTNYYHNCLGEIDRYFCNNLYVHCYWAPNIDLKTSYEQGERIEFVQLLGLNARKRDGEGEREGGENLNRC